MQTIAQLQNDLQESKDQNSVLEEQVGQLKEEVENLKRQEDQENEVDPDKVEVERLNQIVDLGLVVQNQVLDKKLSHGCKHVYEQSQSTFCKFEHNCMSRLLFLHNIQNWHKMVNCKD